MNHAIQTSASEGSVRRKPSSPLPGLPTDVCAPEVRHLACAEGRRSLPSRAVDGFVLADKPEKMGSAALVAALRKQLDGQKTGHAGTLDRFASGLMLLVVGRATAFADYFLHQDKSYRARFQLGSSTDTHDPEGSVIEERSRSDTAAFFARAEKEIIESVENFKNCKEQTPPVYSALKIDGRRFSDLAREGKALTPKRRSIKVHSVRITDLNSSEGWIEAEMSVSSGTYIRSFARDLGECIQFPVVLSRLRRLTLGSFSEQNDLWKPGKEAAIISPVDLPWMKVIVSRDESNRIRQGKNIEPAVILPEGDFLFVDEENHPVAWAKSEGEGYRYRRVFV